jgi:hypothetical protein
MEAAIFGLVGVVLGAIITGGTQIFLDWRRQRHDLETAKRLIEGELLQSILVVRSLNDVEEWPPSFDVDRAFATSAWQEHRVQLARSLPEATWNEVVLTYAEMQTFRTHVALLMDSADRTKDWSITDASKKQFQRTIDALEGARNRLRGREISALDSPDKKETTTGGDSG